MNVFHPVQNVGRRCVTCFPADLSKRKAETVPLPNFRSYSFLKLRCPFLAFGCHAFSLSTQLLLLRLFAANRLAGSPTRRSFYFRRRRDSSKRMHVSLSDVQSDRILLPCHAKQSCFQNVPLPARIPHAENRTRAFLS